MKNHQVEYSIKGMCACFGVSRSEGVEKPESDHPIQTSQSFF